MHLARFPRRYSMLHFELESANSGKTICAVITHDSVARLGLNVGEPACAVFKASAVILCKYA